MKERYDSLDVDNKLVWNFRDIGHTIRHISEGKGSQKRILIILNDVNRITQRELTERIGIQPGSASEVIGKLEASGFITRTQSKTDHRTTDITLTETGKAAAIDAAKQRKERHKQMFSCFSDEEKNTLLSLLEKVNRSWDQQYRENDGEYRSGNCRKGRGHRCHKAHKE